MLVQGLSQAEVRRILSEIDSAYETGNISQIKISCPVCGNNLIYLKTIMHDSHRSAFCGNSNCNVRIEE